MHTNHRRRKPRYRSGLKYRWFSCRSLKYYRHVRASIRRREERDGINKQQWDDLMTKYPKDIGWEF